MKRKLKISIHREPEIHYRSVEPSLYQQNRQMKRFVDNEFGKSSDMRNIKYEYEILLTDNSANSISRYLGRELGEKLFDFMKSQNARHNREREISFVTTEDVDSFIGFLKKNGGNSFQIEELVSLRQELEYIRDGNEGVYLTRSDVQVSSSGEPSFYQQTGARNLVTSHPGSFFRRYSYAEPEPEPELEVREIADTLVENGLEDLFDDFY